MSGMEMNSDNLLYINLTGKYSRLYSEIAEQALFTCKITHSLDEADDLIAENHHIGAIIVDVDVLENESLEKVKVIKRAYPSIPIFIALKTLTESFSLWAINNNVRGVFIKPASTYEVLKKIESVYSMKSKNHEYREITREPEPAKSYPDGVHSFEPYLFENRVKMYVAENYTDHITSSTAAEHCNLSNAYFCRKFKSTFDLNFSDYVTRYRIQKAKYLLINSHESISSIASEVGYSDISYFTSQFKKHMGISPNHYRQTRQDQDDSKLMDTGMFYA